MQAGFFSTVNDWLGKRKSVNLPGGTYQNNCSGCTASVNKSDLYTLQCKSCKKQVASSFTKKSSYPSVTYRNPKTSFYSDADGQLVENNALTNMFVNK